MYQLSAWKYLTSWIKFHIINPIAANKHMVSWTLFPTKSNLFLNKIQKKNLGQAYKNTSFIDPTAVWTHNLLHSSEYELTIYCTRGEFELTIYCTRARMGDRGFDNHTCSFIWWHFINLSVVNEEWLSSTWPIDFLKGFTQKVLGTSKTFSVYWFSKFNQTY